MREKEEEAKPHHLHTGHILSTLFWPVLFYELLTEAEKCLQFLAKIFFFRPLCCTEDEMMLEEGKGGSSGDSLTTVYAAQWNILTTLISYDRCDFPLFFFHCAKFLKVRRPPRSMILFKNLLLSLVGPSKFLFLLQNTEVRKTLSK